MSGPYGEFLLPRVRFGSGTSDHVEEFIIPDGVTHVCAVLIGEGGSNYDGGLDPPISQEFYRAGSGGGGGCAWGNRIPIVNAAGQRATKFIIKNNRLSIHDDTHPDKYNSGLRLTTDTSDAPILQVWHAYRAGETPNEFAYGGDWRANASSGSTVHHAQQYGGGKGGNGAAAAGVEYPDGFNVRLHSISGGGAAGGYLGDGPDGMPGGWNNGTQGVQAASGTANAAGGAGAGCYEFRWTNAGAGGGTSPYGTEWQNDMLDDRGLPVNGEGGFGKYMTNSRPDSSGRHFGGSTDIGWFGGGEEGHRGFGGGGAGSNCIRIIWGDGRAFPGTNVGPDWNNGLPFDPGDIFLVNKNGNSYRVKYENLKDVAGTILVSRGGVNRKVNLATNWQSLRADDVVLVNRGGKSYKATAGNIISLFE